MSDAAPTADAAGRSLLSLETLTRPLARAWADPYLRWAVAASLAGLALRSLWIVYANPDPTDGRFDDTAFYYRAAQHLSWGNGYVNFLGLPTAQWPIGYPGLLALIFVIFGQSLVAAKALNVFLGVATVLGVYGLGSLVFNKRAGLVAAVILAFFPSQIFYSTLVMTEVLFTALVVLMAYLVVRWTVADERPPAYRLFAIGVLMGYMAIVRGEGSMLIAGLVVFWIVVLGSWRKVLRPAALLVAGALIAITPWTVRNFIDMDAPVLISTGIGSALWQGHHHGVYSPGDVVLPAHLYDRYKLVPYPEREIKINNAAMREALTFIRENPDDEAKLLVKKLYHLYREDALGLAWIESAGARSSIPESSERQLTVVANGYYWVVLGWAALTAPLWFSIRDRRRLFLALIVVVWTGTHLLFIPNPRYHFPLIPIFTVLAAGGVTALWARWRAAKEAAP